MQTKRFEALDGWRGIAALAIAFYHVPLAHPLRDLVGWKNMELFVDFFFVLSGFVIAHAWGARIIDGASARVFVGRRFWRVWPLHIVILMAFVLIELVKFIAVQKLGLSLDEAPFTGNRSLEAMLTNIVMVQSFNLHGTTTWNGPAWSISVEFWTYIVFMLTVLVFMGRALWGFLALAAIGAAGLALASPIYLFATHDFGLLRAFYGFFIGAAAYRLAMAPGQGASFGHAGELACVALAGLYLMATGTNATSLLAPLVFAMIVLVFAQGRGVVSGVLKSRFVQALGLWSYSIYLIHVLLYYVLRLGLMLVQQKAKLNLTAAGAGNERIFTLGHGLIDGAVILGLLALTIWIASQTYRWIEKPFMSAAGEPKSAARAEKTPAGQLVSGPAA